MFAFDTLRHRLRAGSQTMAYPKGPAPALPDRHGGALRLDSARCAEGCTACLPVCPTEAITRPAGQPTALDLGRCLFCSECVRVCPTQAVTHTNDHRLAARHREDLLLGRAREEEVRLAEALDGKLRRMFGRSLRLRQVSAGGCNACEADLNVRWSRGRRPCGPLYPGVPASSTDDPGRVAAPVGKVEISLRDWLRTVVLVCDVS
jgi:formate hydrogenlyase subunit 6/NADH:ubiquinone oxidoreductase subunit I